MGTPVQPHAAELLEEMRKLMHLKGENVFKVRAFEKGAEAVAGRDDLVELARKGALTSIEGIGKGIAEVLNEYLLKGTATVRDELKASLPAGLMELTELPGLGPKKAMQLIEELDIHSVRELEYACKENRLLKLKGFGVKVQEKILEGIRFLNSSQGQLRIDDAQTASTVWLNRMRESAETKIELTGALRRSRETVSELEFLIEGSESKRSKLEERSEVIRSASRISLPIKLHFSEARHFGFHLVKTSSTDEHWQALGAPAPFEATNEAEFYQKLKLPEIPAEARETGEEVKLAREGRLSDLLPYDGVAGVFHNHTTRSDGTATLEEMVQAARAQGYKYLGISDHSQTAFYAQGLKVDSLDAQEKEVRKLQDKYTDIRIFWGIESDILADGSLDYEQSQLKRFDFVVASIHQRFKQDRQSTTDRLLTAIRNPATRFLGHVTGRLLLGRPGYDLDMEAVIREASRQDVAIEINANPARLDIDWRWGPALRNSETLVSINPDAHATEELENTRFGIAMARKALLPRSLVVNSRDVRSVEKWLKREA